MPQPIQKGIFAEPHRKDLVSGTAVHVNAWLKKKKKETARNICVEEEADRAGVGEAGRSTIQCSRVHLC